MKNNNKKKPSWCIRHKKAIIISAFVVTGAVVVAGVCYLYAPEILKKSATALLSMTEQNNDLDNQETSILDDSVVDIECTDSFFDYDEDDHYYDDCYDDDERISVYDAADIWVSSGKDEDYMFGYSEYELENAL